MMYGLRAFRILKMCTKYFFESLIFKSAAGSGLVEFFESTQNAIKNSSGEFFYDGQCGIIHHSTMNKFKCSPEKQFLSGKWITFRVGYSISTMPLPVTTEDKSTYLGFDLSTQKIFCTACYVGQSYRYCIRPVGCPRCYLSTVGVIAGSTQQHGSLYWSRHGIETLTNLNPDKFLHLQIDDSAFVLTRTPIWMDSSTESQCVEMETAIGGREEMIAITGSKCYPRFTGPQIRKVYQQRTHAYEDAERISLVSSFLASIFLGSVAPIDYADASGMNLFDINQKNWSVACLNACAPDLESRLAATVETNAIIGNVSNFFVQRFGIPAECKVAAFTGDNPSALSGMLIQQNWIIMSLGTSDTVMINLRKHPKLEQGHVLCHPTENDKFMGLLCFQNGSLVREALKKSDANDNWDIFNTLLDSTPRGNYGNMALHFPVMEIIPKAKGVLRWNKDHCIKSPEAAKGLMKFNSSEAEIRALIEGQMLHKRAVTADMGFHFGKDTNIIVTGGASVNTSILQVISDVFNAPVYVQEKSEAALMGAAYRAKYAHYLYNQDTQDKSLPLNYYDYIINLLPNHAHLACKPNKDSEEIYKPMIPRYREMARILEQKQFQ